MNTRVMFDMTNDGQCHSLTECAYRDEDGAGSFRLFCRKKSIRKLKMNFAEQEMEILKRK
jgi:hypothetical protein